MRKCDFWKTDWFLGVAVVIAVALFARLSDLVPDLERLSRAMQLSEIRA